MKLFRRTAKFLIIPVAVAGVMFSGIASAQASTLPANVGPASPQVIGTAQWMYFGINYDSCMALQNAYQSEGAHIISSCHDTTSVWDHFVGVDNNYGFEYQWQ
jgi:hypothetical protein